MFIRTSLSFTMLLVSHTPLAQITVVQSVSPGALQNAARISDGCPTFSWGQSKEANSYELAIFDTLGDEDSDYQTHFDAAQPFILTRIAAPALSWTPSTGQCLEHGESYVWFIRATNTDTEGDWSQGRRFEVDLGGGVLAETVREEVTHQLSQPATWQRMIQYALKADPGVVVPTINVGTVLRSKAPGSAVRLEYSASGRVNEGESEKVGSTRAATFVNPSAFRVSSPSGVVFDNPGGVGNIPAEGGSTRFMWYPGKAALRAGHVSGTQWDSGNTGVYSVALGYNTVASGDGATAMGQSTWAAGGGTTALGSGTFATNIFSTAMGYSTSATGIAAVAMGASTRAGGTYSTAMGKDTWAKGVATTAIGSFSSALGTHSVTIGNGLTANSYNEIVMGSYNTLGGGNSGAWVPTDRLFAIGNGNYVTPSDALVVLKNGNLGIGNSDPQNKLHVIGEVNG